jgi:hypothetical protein
MKHDTAIRDISSGDFARLFGAGEDEVLAFCGDLIARGDFRHRVIEGVDRDRLILQVRERIEDHSLARSGEDRQPDWESGWRENLDEFVRSGFDVTKLIPKYFRVNVPARLDGGFIQPRSPDFVFAYTHVYRTWLYRKYFREAQRICEFGCGPAYQLAYLATLFPEAELTGLDWAQSSVEIVGHLRRQFGWNISGRLFDFFHPDRGFRLKPDSAVLTFGALEQVGRRHGPFVDYLLENAPALCVHIECLEELYEPGRPLDALALAYHRRRNYLSGFLTRLRQLEADGRIELVACHHHRFGNLYDHPLSYVIWKPR